MRRHLFAFVLALTTGYACDDTKTATASRDVGQPDSGVDQSVTRPDAEADAAKTETDAYVPVRPTKLPIEGTLIDTTELDLTEAVEAEAARAGEVTTAAERLTGPAARCRIGDFRMDNQFMSVCIQSVTTFSQFSFTGGNLIDAHPAHLPGTDSLREIVTAPGLGEIYVSEVGVLKDGSDGGPAVVRAIGRTGGSRFVQGALPNSFVPPDVSVVVEYRLDPSAEELQILTWFSLDPEIGSAQLQLYELVYFGDLNQTIWPEHREYSTEPLPFVAAMGSVNSYGWYSRSGPMRATILAALDIPGSPVEYDTISLRGGDMVLIERAFSVVEGGIEALRPDQENEIAVSVNGLPGTIVIIERDDEIVVTTVRLNEAGMATVSLRPGEYNAHTHGYDGGEIDEPFTVDDTTQSVTLEQPLPGRLRVRITDATGTSIAAKLKLVGPTDRLEFVVDEKEVLLPAGMWQIRASRGWHYSIDRTAVAVGAGETVDVDLTLTEQIPLVGYASGEFHQHASPSLDSELPVRERVLSNIVEGVSFMVPSDHDIIYDYASLVERMGLSDRISVPMTGVEVSPLFTHLGAYGIPYDPYAGSGGALELPLEENGFWRVYRVPELIDQARERGARTIQVNHPRASQGYFDHVGYHAAVPIEALDEDEFSPDFDAIEVFNGGGDFCQVLNDWMGLLNQGHRSTAIGNSDTHRREKPPGYPRNYVPTLAPDPVAVTQDEVVDAIERGELTIGGDAFMAFTGEVQPGQTVDGSSGTVSVQLRLQTPDYTALDRLIIFSNGQPIYDEPLNAPLESLIDFDDTLAIAVSEDTHIEILALGERRAADTEDREIFALSNPVFVDFDGGGITPIGVGEIPLMEFSFCRNRD